MNIKNLSDKIVHTLKLPCKRYHGTNLINSIKASTKKSFPEFHDVRILTGTKLSSHFNIKDNTNEQRKNAQVILVGVRPRIALIVTQEKQLGV